MKKILILGNEQPKDRQVCINFLTAKVDCEGEFKAQDSVVIAHVLYEKEPELLGVVALNNWTTSTCEGHIASDGSGRWMNRNFAFTVYEFVFVKAKRMRMNFMVEVTNTKAITMHEKLGHKRECLLEHVYGENRHGYLYGLTRDQWLAGKFSKPSKGITNGNV